MNLFYNSRIYENLAPFLGRIFFASLFLVSAYSKIPGTGSFLMEVDFTSRARVPFPQVAVTLAFLLEIFFSICLVIGWNTRLAAFLLAIFVAILTLVFHLNFSNLMEIGVFLNHLGLIGGLLYISVYGSKSLAISKD